ncbi:Bromodomain [Seminavis robusta]|uniref:Bromodomain n=1 Tax=Seminavis robusta TaxID=568900 RepID=A0A9N8DVK1_9STRA|nr:Bromodomain [Seminavis robusta]|eukprot:Sro390_g132740.1 Bromodomain (503) ;mRNA; r:4386-6151
MEDTKKAASKKTATAAATGKKKRANSRPAQEGKSAKKKKKDAEVAVAVPAVATAATAAAGGKKRKKNAAPAGATPSNLPMASLPVSATTSSAAPSDAVGPSASISTPNATVDLELKTKPLVDQVLYRLTEGVPRMELKTMDKEADECERELLREIQMMEASLENLQEGKAGLGLPLDDTAGDGDKKEAASTKKKAKSKAEKGNLEALGMTPEELDQQVDIILDNPLTPLDKYYTLSALVGRLRDDLAVPSTRAPSAAVLAATTAAGNKKKKANSIPAPTYSQLMAMANDNPNFTMIHPDPPTQLLQVWRKIASHRTSTVFRKPVKPEDAPGYAERILFPMDLSLVRKMIVAKILTSYSDVHQKIRLICHNCVKYNGRESDYGVVARDFEACVDEYIYNAVQQPVAQGSAPTGKLQALKAVASGRASPKNFTSGRASPKTIGMTSGRASPKLGMGRLPTNKKLAPATATAPSSAAVSMAAAAAAAAAAAKPPPAPKTTGKKTK